MNRTAATFASHRCAWFLPAILLLFVFFFFAGCSQQIASKPITVAEKVKPKPTLQITPSTETGKSWRSGAGGNFTDDLPLSYLTTANNERITNAQMEQAPIIQLVQLPKGYFKFEQIAYYGTPPEEIFAVTLAAFETAFEVSIKEEEYETDGYYLTVANQELAQKLEPGKEHLMGEGFGEESLIPPVSMKQLAGYLQRQLNSVVLDRTELAGAFMLKIQLNEKGPRNLKKFNDALTEFGLKLEPFSSPEKVKAVVIRSTKE